MDAQKGMPTEYRFFGIPEADVRERLSDLLESPLWQTELLCREEEAVLRISPAAPEADAGALPPVDTDVRDRLGAYLYSDNGEDLPHRVVSLLRQRKKTVAAAESCTGGLLTAMLTGVPGCSAVLGTGVVSYSRDCKMKLLRVRRETLSRYGAVSRQTAGEMARGVRDCAGADIGVAITGEAGPSPAEDRPVGTVFVALADARRTWVKELHLSGDRNAVRRMAACHALDLLRRYLEAYPTVMAGGVASAAQDASLLQEHRRLLPAVLPWRGDSRRRVALKLGAWLLALALLLGSVVFAYQRILAPGNNRELQNSLGKLYWVDTADLTENVSGNYPLGMTAQFRTLYDLNPDIAGWIRITDTGVNYPVMSFCGGYYQNHNFNDQYSLYGQPYMVEPRRPAADSLPSVTRIDGKNTQDEQMFSSLLSYRRIAYLQEHPVIEMNTLFESSRWEIFAVVPADGSLTAAWDYAAVDFADAQEKEAYLAQLRRRSLFLSDAAVTAGDRILLLSTNAEREYGHNEARLVIAARRMTEDTSRAAYTANGSVRMPERWSSRRVTTARPSANTTPRTTATATTASVTKSQRPTVMSTTAAPSSTKGTGTDATTATRTDDSTATTVDTAVTEPTLAGDPSDPAAPVEEASIRTETEEHDDIRN